MVEAKNYESQYTEGEKLERQGASGIVYLAIHKQEKKKYVAKKTKFEPTPADLIKCL